MWIERSERLPVKWLLVLFFFSSVAFAESRPFELAVSPSFSFYSPGSTRFSVGAFFKIPISDHFQLKLGDDNLVAGGGARRLVAGLNYNFTDDWMSSFFVGIGAGYQRHAYERSHGNRNYWIGYAEAGKRFTLIKSWGLSYSPQVQFSWGPDTKAEIRVMPANLSLFF